MQKTYSTKNGPSIPTRSYHFPSCLFETSVIPLSPKCMASNGIFVEVEIPADLPPSYRGMVGVVAYYFTLSIKNPTSECRYIHFPLHITSPGSTSTVFKPQFSSLVAYSVSSLPVEVTLCKPHDIIYSEIGCRGDDPSHRGQNIYKVHDNEYICSITVEKASISPGHAVAVVVDFSGNRQPCQTLRATLLQSEQRADGSQVQQRVICSELRFALSASKFHLSLDVSEDLPASFTFPLFQLEYKLEFEFGLLETETIPAAPVSPSKRPHSSVKSLSFEVPIQVAPVIAIGSLPSRDNVDLSLCRQYLLHQCMEQSYQSFPQFEI